MLSFFLAKSSLTLFINNWRKKNKIIVNGTLQKIMTTDPPQKLIKRALEADKKYGEEEYVTKFSKIVDLSYTKYYLLSRF